MKESGPFVLATNATFITRRMGHPIVSDDPFLRFRLRDKSAKIIDRPIGPRNSHAPNSIPISCR
jgi:hypothetical protein